MASLTGKRRCLPVLFLVAAGVLALALRLPRLSLRPLHTDEAVQAVKTGDLYDTGLYRYDPFEFHGPTLPYLTLPALWLGGADSSDDASATCYRIVPVCFGVGLVLLHGLLLPVLGWPAILFSALFTAVSPALVFYSRYYIHETLLVVFTFGAIAAAVRFARTPTRRRAVVLGCCVALMHATKETWVLAAAAMVLAVPAMLLWTRLRDRSTPDCRPALAPGLLLAGLGAAAVVTTVLFSSFLTNWRGPLDSVLAYTHYLGRGSGGNIHDHPWHYYLELLAFVRHGRGPVWSEATILLLGAAGVASALTGRFLPIGVDRRFARWLAFYALFQLAAYCVIPYKTPWCILSVLHAFTVLAGLGVSALVLAPRRAVVRALLCLIPAACVFHLGRQAVRANSRRFCSDRRNPYVYAHTVPDFVRLGARIENLAALHPGGRDMLVHVFTDDYWPLPWYVRRLSRVGYWDTPIVHADAPVIVTSPGQQGGLDSRLTGEYHVEYYGLRPEVVVLLYVERGLWNRFLARQARAPAPAPPRAAERETAKE